MDGHSGISNAQVNTSASGCFKLILSYLKDSAGGGTFVIHATSNVGYSAGISPLDFLSALGFQLFRGPCQFHGDRCLFRQIAQMSGGTRGDSDAMFRTDSIHNGFKKFGENLEQLYQMRRSQDNILREIGLSCGEIPIFNVMPKVVIPATKVPSWADAVKFSKLLAAEKQRAEIDNQIKELSGFLPLLFGTGPELEAAVQKSLTLLGMTATPTQQGFTADILAEAKDGRKFGIEVTGTNGAIKKDSKKLTQVLEFERIKEHGEKTILVANTFCDKPIAERETLEHFTKPVVDFLSPYPILLMTGWNLYCMVRDVLAGTAQPDSFIKALHEKRGVYVA